MSHIKINMVKAKDICHTVRRDKRDKAYLPIDGGSIYAQLNAAGKTKRAAVKAQDDQFQIDIDAATTSEELKAILESM